MSAIQATTPIKSLLSNKSLSQRIFSSVKQNRFYTSNASKPKVTVFGGSGFLGKSVVRALQPHCEKIVVATRYPETFEKSFQQESKDGVVVTQKVNAVSKVDVQQAIEGADVVINMIGTVHEYENTYLETFMKASSNVAHACHVRDIQRLIKVSCLGAEVDHDSIYLDNVYRGQDITFAAYPDVTLVKTSLIFGHGSHLFNRLMKYASLYPFIPVPNGQGKFQPVYVEDVAQAIVKCVQNDKTDSTTIELGGPNTYNISQLIKAVQKSSKPTITLPKLAFEYYIAIRQFLPDPLMSRDHLDMFDADMAVRGTPKYEGETVLTFKDLEISPKSLEEVLYK